jgi:membrane protein YqaA with SNARE-associated domain
LLHKITIALVKITAALAAFGPFGILALGVIDSLGIPLPSATDYCMLAVAVDAPQRAYFTALMAVIGSSVGSIILFLGARHGRRIFSKGGEPSERSRKFQEWFHRYGLLTVFIPAVTPIIPLPMKVFVVSAGAFHTKTSRFLIVLVAARLIRYFGEAYLGLQLGKEGVEPFLRHNIWPLVGAVLVMTLGLLALMRFIESRRAPEI